MWPRVWGIFKKLGLGDTLIPFFDHYPDHEPRMFVFHYFRKMLYTHLLRGGFRDQESRPEERI